jgi:hypothetical protein
MSVLKGLNEKLTEPLAEPAGCRDYDKTDQIGLPGILYTPSRGYMHRRTRVGCLSDLSD